MTSDRFDADGDAPALPPPSTDPNALDAAIDDADVVGFVAVGSRFDPDHRYLTRFEGSERAFAFVRAAGTSVVCASSGYAARAERRFDGRVATDHVGDPAGERAAAVLDGLGAGRTPPSASPATVLVPPTIPHDAAVYLERAGYELQSTTVVADARVTKSKRELDAIGGVQRSAIAAVREVERLLATASVDDGALTGDGRPLTSERLRRATNAELATRGVTDAGNTVVATGGTRSRGVENGARSAVIRAGDPVAIAVAPCGPYGYYGLLARTFVVDSDGGWERRAYVAVESALDAALAAIEAGAVAAAVGREVDAELAAFGFDPGAEAGVDGPAAPGHGLGLSRRERPRLDADTELEVGNVVAVEPRVADPKQGVIRLSAVVVVTADGYERVGDGEPSFSPRD